MRTNLKALAKNLAFGQPASISRAVFEQTQGRTAQRAYMNLYNNCNVEEHNGSHVLIHATATCAAWIAMEAGFRVWTTDRPNYWIVECRRVGLRVV